MSKFFRLILFFQLFSVSFLLGQDIYTDSVIEAERDYFYNKYRSIRDTMKINTWLNLKRVSDNLEQVVKRDQVIIDVLNNRISEDSAIIANLKDISLQYNQQKILVKKLNASAKTDALMILYLKIAFVLLSFFLLFSLFLFVKKDRRVKKYRKLCDLYESNLEERQHQIDILDSDLRKLKTREMEFREELEKGVKNYQERLIALQERCKELENMNQELKDSHLPEDKRNHQFASESIAKLEMPENVEDMKHLIRSLYDERNSLINLAGKLRSQTEEEVKKNSDIIERINKLAKDLGNSKY